MKTPQVYTEQELDSIVNQFMDDLIELRKEANSTQLSTEAVYLADAENLCTIGITGNDVSAFLSMQEEKDKQEQENWIDKNYWKLLAIFAPIAILILGYVIIKSV